MRVLSAKLELVPDFEREDLYAIITEWLKLSRICAQDEAPAEAWISRAR